MVNQTATKLQSQLSVGKLALNTLLDTANIQMLDVRFAVLTPKVVPVIPGKGEAEMIEVTLPSGAVTETVNAKYKVDDKAIGYVLPQFMPHYYVSESDVAAYQMALNTYTKLVEHGQEKTPEAKLLKLFAVNWANFSKDHYYGSGTPDGQVKRLLKVRMVKKLRPRLPGLGRHVVKLSNADREFIWEQFTPCGSYTFGGTGPGKLRTIISDYADQNDGYTVMVTNSKSASGNPWPSYMKRGMTLVQDAQHAESLLNAMEALVAEPSWADQADDSDDDLDELLGNKLTEATLPTKKKTYQALKEYFNKPGHRFYRLAWMKNKAEVYDIEDYKGKTRNIYVFATPVTILGGIFSRMFMNTPKGKRWPHTFDGHGFTVVGGGATRLMTAFLDKSKAFVMVYADNLYWRVAVDGIGVCWVSLDGEKMEGSITTDFIREVIEYGLRHIDVKNQALDGFWHAICPEIFGKAIALLGASQIPLDHMASGNPLTHVCNRMQSMSWLGEWVHSRGLDPLSSNSYMDQTIKTHSYLGGKIRDWRENFLADDSSRYASS